MKLWIIVLLCVIVVIVGMILFVMIGALNISSQISRKEEETCIKDNENKDR